MIYQLKPTFIEKLWGGDYYTNLYQLNKKKIGEVVLFSTHGDYQLLITNPNKDILLKDTNESLYNTLLKLFPITIKLIDAQDDLSIQVHPNDTYAKKHHQSLGKEEYWIILGAIPSSTILIGHDIKDPIELNNVVTNGCLHQHMKRYQISAGDTFYIPANTVHAIQKNTRLLEIAQASILNFRVDDYQRKDENGSYRDLHIQEALEVMSVNDQNLQRTFPTHIFSYDTINVQHTHKFKLKKDIALLIVLIGEGVINNVILKEGDGFIIDKENTMICEGIFTCICVYSSKHM
jgi:mannose-6-phosphate isomerase